MQTLDELKAVLNEWEGDAHDLDSKLASGEIPELDNLDAKMKVELWFALFDAIKRIEALRKFATHKPGCYESGNECICELDDLLAETQEGKS